MSDNYFSLKVNHIIPEKYAFILEWSAVAINWFFPCYNKYVDNSVYCSLGQCVDPAVVTRKALAWPQGTGSHADLWWIFQPTCSHNTALEHSNLLNSIRIQERQSRDLCVEVWWFTMTSRPPWDGCLGEPVYRPLCVFVSVYSLALSLVLVCNSHNTADSVTPPPPP